MSILKLVSYWCFLHSLLMLFGCIMCYLAVIIYGIDESFPNDDTEWNWSIICNVRIILLNISFSLIFGPLLCKVYRIKKLFNFKLKIVTITAEQMILYNIIYVVIDLIMLIIIIYIIPNNRMYIRSIHDNDTHYIQYVGSCSAEDCNYIYYMFLFLPKLCLMIYCIMTSASVYATISIMKFNADLNH